MSGHAGFTKYKIKESLKNGEDIPGCELVQEKRISIK